MKQIEVKTHAEAKLTENENLNTKHLIMMVINNAPPGGFSREDIGKRDRIEQAVTEAKEGFPITLEDADFDELHSLAKSMKWPSRLPFIKDFVDGLADIKSVKPADMSDLKPSENGKAKKLDVVK